MPAHMGGISNQLDPNTHTVSQGVGSGAEGPCLGGVLGAFLKSPFNS